MSFKLVHYIKRQINLEDFPALQGDSKDKTRQAMTIYHVAALEAMADFASNDTHETRISYKTIASVGKMGKSKAIEAVNWLEIRGLIKKTRQKRDGKKESDSNLYIVLPSCVINGKSQIDSKGEHVKGLRVIDTLETTYPEHWYQGADEKMGD